MQKIIFTLLVILFCNSSYANSDWIPYSAPLIPPQIVVPQTPAVTYSTQEYYIPRPLMLTYDWVPYYTTKTVVVERLGFLCKYRTVTQQPVIEWVYQPVWR